MEKKITDEKKKKKKKNFNAAHLANDATHEMRSERTTGISFLLIFYMKFNKDGQNRIRSILI